MAFLKTEDKGNITGLDNNYIHINYDKIDLIYNILIAQKYSKSNKDGTYEYIFCELTGSYRV